MASRLYHQTANKIIMDSIKSVVFIDEKALEFYKKIPKVLEPEERLSINLLNRFKKRGASLAVHKFNSSDISNVELKKYLFDNRDLVLLDWELDQDYVVGKGYSLKLLSDVVSTSHLHFCAIYTSTIRDADVFDNIISFFSGRTSVQFEEIRDALSEHEDGLRKVLNRVDLYDLSKNSRVIPELNNLDRGLIGEIKAATGINDLPRALKYAKIAFSDLIKSEIENLQPDIVDRNNQIIVINNTIITLIKKNHNKDPENLIRRLSSQVSISQNSFTQLLGIEMQNVFAKKGSFIDANLLNVSLETFLYHRSQMSGAHGDLPFEIFMKELLLAHAKLNLRSEKLSILDSTFLTSISPKKPKASDSEIAKINTFYNGSILSEDRTINFGDIFHYENTTYLMCITPLCDCLYPNDNIKNKFYFVKGQKFSTIQEPIALGDEAFISYVDEATCISWAGIGKSTKQDKHKPIYVKPLQLYIPNNNIINSTLSVLDWFEGEPKPITLTYKFTLRQQYAQRIANHAFAHPIRVGVDFVKK